MYARIVGTGSYLPEKVLTNHDLAQRVDTTDEWIATRTGIRQRHIAADDQNASDMALLAARRALDAAGIGADELLGAAKAMQRTLPFPIRLVAENGAVGMRLVVGRDYLSWKSRNSRLHALWQKGPMIASLHKVSLKGVR